MLQKIRKKSLLKSVQLLCVLFATLLVWGCGGGGGSDSYDAPESTQTSPVVGQTQNVLIDAPTLKGWIDAGLVNNDESYENVVILYRGGDGTRIPGAQEWATVGEERVEGPILSGNMVLSGEVMDAMMQERGIDENTTIVFADGQQRIYFHFLYWGFPQDQLKILNGYSAAWKAYGYEMTSIVPDVTPSDFSVKDLPVVRDELRASLNEAIIGVTEGTVTPYNTYGSTEADEPKIKETIRDASSFVIFQGLMLGGVTDNFLAGLSKTVEINGTEVSVYKDAAEMRAFLTDDLGVDLSKPIMTYCRAGNLASYGFAPLYAVLGNEVDVMMYDGSWSQWGSLTNYTDVPSADYTLPAGYEEWATDILTESIYYNYNGTDVLSLPEWHEAPASPYDAGANTIEDEDNEYQDTLPEGSTPTSSSGGSGGGC